MMEDDRVITVCDSCLRACCWHGIFYCDNYKTAGLIEKSVRELKQLQREHPSYWSKAHLEKIYGSVKL